MTSDENAAPLEGVDCPALHRRELGYPFGDQVPGTVRMLRTVLPGAGPMRHLLMAGHEPPIAVVGAILPAWTNSFGAVSVVFPDGHRMYVRPYDFEVVEWQTPRTKGQ